MDAVVRVTRSARRRGPRRHLIVSIAVIAWRSAPPTAGRNPDDRRDATGSIAPPATATPSPSPSAAAFPVTLTDDEGTEVDHRGRAAEDRLADPGHDRDPVRPRRRRPRRRQGRGLRDYPPEAGRDPGSSRRSTRSTSRRSSTSSPTSSSPAATASTAADTIDQLRDARASRSSSSTPPTIDERF